MFSIVISASKYTQFLRPAKVFWDTVWFTVIYKQEQDILYSFVQFDMPYPGPQQFFFSNKCLKMWFKDKGVGTRNGKPPPLDPVKSHWSGRTHWITLITAYIHLSLVTGLSCSWLRWINWQICSYFGKKTYQISLNSQASTNITADVGTIDQTFCGNSPEWSEFIRQQAEAQVPPFCWTKCLWGIVIPVPASPTGAESSQKSRRWKQLRVFQAG